MPKGAKQSNYFCHRRISSSFHQDYLVAVYREIPRFWPIPLLYFFTVSYFGFFTNFTVYYRDSGNFAFRASLTLTQTGKRQLHARAQRWTAVLAAVAHAHECQPHFRPLRRAPNVPIVGHTHRPIRAPGTAHKVGKVTAPEAGHNGVV